MAKACMFAYFYKKALTRIVTDASPVGLGVTLLQKQDGFWIPVNYASQILTDYESTGVQQA